MKIRHVRVGHSCGPLACGEPIAAVRKRGEEVTRDLKRVTCLKCCQHHGILEASRNIPSSYVG